MKTTGFNIEVWIHKMGTKMGQAILWVLLGCQALASEKYSAQIAKIDGFFAEIEENESIGRKFSLNDSVAFWLDEILEDTLSLSCNFDSLGLIGVLTSPDGLFRIYNWHLKLSPDYYQYFAKIQYHDKSSGIYKIIDLKDQSENITDYERTTSTDTSWFGALYYDIIPKELGTVKYYTLLGFDFNSIVTRKKIIEVLYFKDHMPKFGKPVFQCNGKMANHVVFEYSMNAIMTLRYDTGLDMIVFDHLSPMKPNLEGLYEFYGPDLSYDAYKFENGLWNYIPKIDIRNPKKKKNKK